VIEAGDVERAAADDSDVCWAVVLPVERSVLAERDVEQLTPLRPEYLAARGGAL
jgi:hypothetical protein